MRFTEQQVQEILSDVEDGKSLSEISYFLNIPYKDLWEACYGSTGKRIRKNHDDEVVEMVDKGFSTPYIAKKLGISAPAVSKIYKRVTGSSITEARKSRSVRYGSK